jgi:hypothetical protein
MILGNESARDRLKQSIAGSYYPIMISGPYGVGKQTSCSQIALDLDYDLNLVSKTEVLTFVRSYDHFRQDKRINFLDSVETFSETAQDALLKICEENIDGLNMVLSTADIGRVSAPLLSRARSSVVFKPVNKSDLILKHKDKMAAEISGGSFAVCQRIVEKPVFMRLYNILTQKDQDIPQSIPKGFFAEFNKMDIDVMSMKCVLWTAAKNSGYDLRLLELARRFEKCPSLDLDLHIKSLFIDVT